MEGRNPESATVVKCWTDCEGFFRIPVTCLLGMVGRLYFDGAVGCRADRTRTWPFWGCPVGLSLGVSAQSDPGDHGYTRGCAGGSVSLLLLAELH